MEYECQNCHATLKSGMRLCPYCGDKFQNPVPGSIRFGRPIVSSFQIVTEHSSPEAPASVAPGQLLRSKTLLTAISAFIGVVILLAVSIGHSSTPRANAPVASAVVASDVAEISLGPDHGPQRQTEQTEDSGVYAAIKAKSQQDYPKDDFMQKSEYDMEVKSYHYMQSLPDDDVKVKAVQKYPGDYFMQKSEYDLQTGAKQEMQQSFQ